MDTLKNIIDENKNDYPGLKEYLVMLKGVEDNMQEKPDISIEYSKSILEGISKKIISKSKKHSEKKIKDMHTPKLLEEALSELFGDNNLNSNIENPVVGVELFADFVSNLIDYIMMIKRVGDGVEEKTDMSIEYSRFVLKGISKKIISKSDQYSDKDLKKMSESNHLENGLNELFGVSNLGSSVENPIAGFSSFARFVSWTRNNHGEVCHGKNYPKDKTSTEQVAGFVWKITEAITCYMLYYFFEVPEKKSIGKDDKYEDHIEFNKHLDEKNQLPNNISYSKALYEQDPTAYSEGCDAYIENQ